jgi:hypothetical protein
LPELEVVGTQKPFKALNALILPDPIGLVVITGSVVLFILFIISAGVLPGHSAKSSAASPATYGVD